MTHRSLTALATIVAVAALLMPSLAVAQQGGSDQIALTTELAERYVSQGYGNPYTGGYYPMSSTGGPPQAPSLHLLAGRVPDGQNLDVAVPPGGRLIGSVVRTPQAQGQQQPASGIAIALDTSADVFMDVPGDPQAVSDQLTSELASLGWEPQTYPYSPYGGNHGFQQPPITVSSSLCNSTSGRGVVLTVVEGTDGQPNAVRLSTQLQGGCINLAVGQSSMSSAMSMPAPSFSFASVPQNPIPRLRQPDGATTQQTSAMPTSGIGNYSSAANVGTDMDPAALDAFYSQQLASAGWQWTTGGADGPLAWSAWQIPGDQELLGIMTTIATPHEDQRIVTIQVYSDTPTPNYGSSYNNSYPTSIPFPGYPPSSPAQDTGDNE